MSKLRVVAAALNIDGLIIIPMRWRPGRSAIGDSDFLPDVPPA